MSIFRDFGYAMKGSAAPVTSGLVVAIVAGFAASWLGLDRAVASLAFVSPSAFAAPWTFITYPFASDRNSAIGVFFICLWLWGVGGSVERDLRPVRFLAVWLIFSVLCAFGLLLGCLILGKTAVMFGGWTPVAAITILWGTRNPTSLVQLMFVLPITGKWVAWLSAALVLFATPPELAPFAAAPLALAYFYAANKLPFALYSGSSTLHMPAAKKHERYDKQYYQEVQRREKERAERDRLRKLFESSIDDERDKSS